MPYLAGLSLARLKGLALLSLPIAFSRLSTMLMSFTDAVMLSNYSNNELPYILNAWLPIGIAFAIGLGVLQGVQVITSELVGTNQQQESGRIFRRGFWGAIAMGMVCTGVCLTIAAPLFSVLGFKGTLFDGTVEATLILAYGLVGHMLAIAAMYYLEALHKEGLVTLIAFLGVGVNLVFDLVLVKGLFGFEPMGASGVAWATTLTRYLMVVLLLVAVACVSPALKRVGEAPLGELRRQFTLGLGATLSQVAEFSAFNSTFVIATWVSVAAASAYGMAIQVAGLCFMVFLGIAIATSVQVAEAYGRKDAREIILSSRAGIAVALLLGLFLTIALLIGNEAIARVVYAFAPKSEGVPFALFASLLGLLAFMIIGDGLQVVAAFALRAMGRIWLPSFIHLGSYYLVMLPLGYTLALPMGYGAKGLMMGVVLGCIIAGSLQVLALDFANRRAIKSI